MSILSRFADAIFAFRYGLEPEQPMVQPEVEDRVPWFADGKSYGNGGEQLTHGQKYAAWLAMRRGGDSLPLGPFLPDWQAKSSDY